MSTRQYIGARYVPKFFENPNGTCEWAGSSIGYEALTIVTHLQNSFTSKKNVPAGIDITNTEYWVNTGNYNAYIDEIMHDIGEINTSIENINGDIDDINGDISDLNDGVELNRDLYAGNNRKYVFVGDSYNTSIHHGGWGAGVITRLGLTAGVNVWNSGVGGACFSAGTLLSQLQTLAGGMTADEKNSITDVVVQGAVNDWSASATSIGSGVEACESYVHTTFPNAKYWIILASWSYEVSGIREGTIVAHKTIYQYNKNAKICEAFRIFVDPYFLEDDMVHPTDNGMANLVCSIAGLLNGCETFVPEYSDLQTSFDGVIVYGNIDRYGVHVYKNDSVGFRFLEPITVPGPGSLVTLGTASTVNNLFENSTYFNGYAMYALSDNTFVGGRVSCRVVKNANRSWDLKICSNEILSGNADYPVTNVVGVYLTFDCTLDYFKN